jgi:hypothetical protein
VFLSGVLALGLGGVPSASAEKPVQSTDPPSASVRWPTFNPPGERAPDENVPAAEKAGSEGKAAVAGVPDQFQYYYVAGAELVPRDTAGTTKDYTGAGCSFVTAGSDRIMNTGLHLPDGAILKYLRIFYNDTNATQDVLGYITRYDAGTSTNDLISVSSTGSGGVGTALSAELMVNNVVDNFGHAYVLIGWPDVVGSTVQVCGLRVAYYPPAEGHFQKVTPCRVFDTRDVATQTTGNPLPAPGPHNFRIQGNCGIPNGATAAVINATVVGPTQLGDLRLFPPGGPQPVVSTMNYTAGQPAIANGAVLPLATVAAPTDKDISVVMGMVAAGTIHLIIDVTGYYY